jgi:hypothetical protein
MDKGMLEQCDYISIQVTEEDIKKGKRKDACACPIALALRRLLPRRYHAHVSKRFISGCDGPMNNQPTRGGKVRYCLDVKTPDVARDFIKRFDRGLLVEPFEFLIPNQVL